jgi:hypothetical protein
MAVVAVSLQARDLRVFHIVGRITRIAKLQFLQEKRVGLELSGPPSKETLIRGPLGGCDGLTEATSKLCAVTDTKHRAAKITSLTIM